MSYCDRSILCFRCFTHYLFAAAKKSSQAMTNPRYTPIAVTATATATAAAAEPIATATSSPSDPYNSDVCYPLDAQRHWEDSFFDLEDADEIIAVFDFDYALIENFNTNVGFVTLAGFCLYPPLLGLALLSCAPCFLRKNVEWSARSQHVALTRDGIRFVRDRRKTCWGFSCTDAGRSSKTVPYEMITDCDVQEAAGNTCLCIPNVLATVNIDTASSGGPSNNKELKITGLKDPIGFKKMVWAMKRHNANLGLVGGGAAASAARGVVAESIHRGDSKNAVAASGEGGESIALLLREIRDELRELRMSSTSSNNVGGAGAVQAATEMVDMVTAADAVATTTSSSTAVTTAESSSENSSDQSSRDEHNIV